MRRRHHGRTVLTVAIAWSRAAAAAGAGLLATFDGWTLYGTADAQPKVCFIAAKPSSPPPNGSRDAVLLYVSAWPQDGLRSEVSVKLGFAAERDAETTIEITGPVNASFKLFTAGDRAFMSDATLELKLLEAMKKGSRLTVQTPGRGGAQVTVTFPLQGFSAAFQALASACR